MQAVHKFPPEGTLDPQTIGRCGEPLQGKFKSSYCYNHIYCPPLPSSISLKLNHDSTFVFYCEETGKQRIP